MFKGCNVYHYMGLYLNEQEINDLNIQTANALEIIRELQNHDSVYEFENECHELDKQAFMEAIISMDNKYHEFCYRIINGCFVLFPIEVSYGIFNFDDKLLSYYSDKSVRDAKLSLVCREGISAIVEDMSSSNKQIQSFNEQQQLRKIHSALTMTVE